MVVRSRGLVAAAVATGLILATVTGSAYGQDGEPAADPSDAPAPITPEPEPVPEPEPLPEPEPVPEPEPEPTTAPPPPETPPPAEEPAPDPEAAPADEESAAAATAPGLAPPPVSSLDLASPIQQAAPSSDVTDEFSERLEETAAAVLAAQEALESAETQLEAARERQAETEKARKAAEVVRDEAVQAAAAAKVAEEQAERELVARVDALDQQREILGTLAREAYRSGGPLSSLSVVLASTTPQEFAASLRGVEAVLRSEDVVIAGLAAELADLAEAEARMQAAREEREEAEDVAERALDLAAQAEETARLVAEETESLVEKRAAALTAAQEAQAADLAQYRRLLAASQAVGFSLTGWAQALDDPSALQGTGEFVRPGYGSLTSSFGPRLHPILGYVKLHTGSDYGVGDGGIYSADDGTVILAGYNSAYGNMTVVSHGRIGSSVIATLYAHQSRILVLPGDTVRKAELIGLVGSTGYSTGAHLHFEVRVDGTPVDPEAWLVGAQLPDEYVAPALDEAAS